MIKWKKFISTKDKPFKNEHPIWPPAAILKFEILRGPRFFLILHIQRKLCANFGACIIK